MMAARRILYALGCLLAAVCYLLTLRKVFCAIFLLCALLPLVSGLTLLLCRSLGGTLELPESAEKQSCVPARLHLRGRGPIRAMRIRVKFRASNELTGAQTAFQTEDFHPVRGGMEARLELSAAHCGKISLDILKCELSDPLGLFRRMRRIDLHASALILPDAFETKVELSNPELPDFSGDEFSAVSPGDDPSERFGVRDYREGDSLRSIHWKLSEKYDRTVVHEMSLPVAQSILLVLDNCPTAAFSADAVSRSCEALISVSQALADLPVSHQIGWFARENGAMQLQTVSSLDDLAAKQALLLAAHTAEDECGIAQRMLGDASTPFGDARRILIFAAAPVRNFELLPGNVSVLTPESAPADGLSCLPEHLTRILI